MPGPGKRKKDQAEEEPKGMPVRSLRRTKPDHESAAPKVGEEAWASREQMWGREETGLGDRLWCKARVAN